MRYVVPLAKKLFSRYKDDIITTGKNIAHDVIIKKVPAKKALKRRGKQTLKKILNITNQKGSGIKCHTNSKKTRKPKKQ